MTFFDVILPTFDVYGDFSLILSWLIRGHPVYAGMMTVPMLLNYIFTSYKWWVMEKKKKSDSRKWSWILVLLQFWQQWNVLKVIVKLVKKDDQAEEKKKTMLRELSSIEPFMESMPSMLFMTCIWMHTDALYNVRRYHNKHFHCSNFTSLDNNEKNLINLSKFHIVSLDASLSWYIIIAFNVKFNRRNVIIIIIIIVII